MTINIFAVAEVNTTIFLQKVIENINRSYELLCSCGNLNFTALGASNY
jgi:hypothetical protein